MCGWTSLVPRDGFWRDSPPTCSRRLAPLRPAARSARRPNNRHLQTRVPQALIKTAILANFPRTSGVFYFFCFIFYAPTYQVRFRHLRVRSAKAHSYLPLSGFGHCAGLGRAQKKFGSILLNFHLAPHSKKLVFLPALIMVLPSIIVLFGGNCSGRHQFG